VSLELPRLPSTPATWDQLQIWWQKVTEAIELHDETQDALLAELQTTQGQLTTSQAELAATQDQLAQTQADLADTIAALTGTQGDVSSVSSDVGTLSDRVTALEDPPPVRQDQTPTWSALSGTELRGGGAVPASYAVSNPPLQAEVQAIAVDLVLALRMIKTMIDDLAGNGTLTG
jgi:ABC-type transporter Mla subunit MlaD